MRVGLVPTIWVLMNSLLPAMVCTLHIVHNHFDIDMIFLDLKFHHSRRVTPTDSQIHECEGPTRELNIVVYRWDPEIFWLQVSLFMVGIPRYSVFKSL